MILIALIVSLASTIELGQLFAGGPTVPVKEVSLDGRALPLNGGARVEGDRVLVPLHDFCGSIGAEAKLLDGSDQLAVCREELCVPLNGASDHDTRRVDGVDYVYLDSFGDAFGLTWELGEDRLQIHTRNGDRGLGLGMKPPEFALPDLMTGREVSSTNFLGKPTAFFMWASW